MSSIGDVGTLEGALAIADTAPRMRWAAASISWSTMRAPRDRSKGEETEAFWAEAFDLNFASARRVTGRIAPIMKTAGFGRIINITGALYGKAMNGAAPSKAALLSWSRMLAFELAPHGITVNCVAPGRINSVQIRERLHPTEESRQAFIRDNIPMGRFGEPTELGNVVTFLASPLASYVSGAHIPVDGGGVRLGV